MIEKSWWLPLAANVALLDHLNILVFQWVHAGAGKHPFWDTTSIFFSEGGPYILMLAFVMSWLRSHESERIILIEAIQASVVGLILNQLIGFFYFHPRPYMTGLCTALVRHAPETSFPSDHATLLFAASIYLLMRHSGVLGSIVIVLAFMTAWARVYSGLHFPLDMIGSLGVGLLSAFLTSRLRPHLSRINGWIVQGYEDVKDHFPWRN